MRVSPSEPSSPASFIASVSTLPPLPTVALRIIDRLGDEFIDGNEIADIVEQDPGIAGKLLGVANSAYFSLREPTTDMRDVVNRVLGAEHVRTLAFGLATTQIFNVRRCPSFDAGDFWQRALLAANFCRRAAALCETLSDQERASAFILGLCHRLGLLALAFLKPDELNAVLETRPESRELPALLVTKFGETVEELTAGLARHWKMPDIVIRVYDESAESVTDESRSVLTEVLATAAGAVEHQVCRPADPDFADTAWDEWLDARAAALSLEKDRLAKALRATDAMLEHVRASATALSG